MSITGADGLPATGMAGNVLRPSTTVRISMRLPPTYEAHDADKILHEKLTTDVPYNAKVTIKAGHSGSGWCQKQLNEWLNSALTEAAQKYFDGKTVRSLGEGGSIPFLKELEKKYPETQILAMGVVGPGANIHGPNEKINLVYVRKLIKVLAHTISKC